MMISTALATSLIAGVASAETKVSAYIEKFNKNDYEPKPIKVTT